MSEFYSFKLTENNGNEYDLSKLKGKVVLVVNTATKCGFTPQLNDLRDIYDDYHDRGFELIDVPCNQFGGQAPGTDEEIQSTCTLNFGTKFPRMKKSDVNGENALPLFKWLKSQKGFEGFGMSPQGIAMSAMLLKADPDYKNKPDIKWNFTKFLIDKDGNVVERFEPTHDMKDVRKKVEELLK